MGKEINEHVEVWLQKTVWIWLPFVAFRILVKDVIEKYKKSKEDKNK